MHLTRRAALLSGGLSLGAGLLTACTSRSRPRATPRPVDPDTALRDAAVSRELALLATYDDLLATSPALAPRLGALRAEHEEHLHALGQALPSSTPSSTPSTAPSTTPSTTPSATPSASPLPGGLVRLRALERSTAEAHAAAALTASRRLAPALASLAASEASHAAVL
ncbi:MAG: hypothetical protein ACXVGH_01450 [Mycobacteriales bacterium]